MEEGLGGMSLLLEMGFSLCVPVISQWGFNGRSQAAAAFSKCEHEKKSQISKLNTKTKETLVFQPIPNLTFYLSCYFVREKHQLPPGCPGVDFHGLYPNGEQSAGTKGLAELGRTSPQLALPSVFEPF